jgi:hypothetical protein
MSPLQKRPPFIPVYASISKYHKNFKRQTTGLYSAKFKNAGTLSLKLFRLKSCLDNVKLKFVISSEARNLPKFGAP